ncbi:PTS transporter subunit EIIC [Kytococcus sedentarius]|uniref:Glucose/maltose/N-acetylglucosamine-specific phosphotransferase system IIC component n=1 Tax=Kytococcus sedentarius (strain ATCC 14392 / DSM 20547 / JCM 11482 / CCUG 33030 / NBRC 15357 / NCTC 11040 / CCM 314 / 541) TaxID=478801 RepID=C7NIR7_KYTSD|nr:PTS transporter subunit EIIC [Kytococcus sedentarius]ACV06705.1 glucose/maltose/N-acetylglucosamine-specific phosphotransferase system IIC component [Kytococcus sedentarius DSM 20547]QQB64986.1 PTS transporter subunit EIIC [Kytococcus sedentarius]STX14480.1 EIICB-Glc [Kytococcus sedentarius]
MSTVDETGLAGEPPEGGLTTEPKKRLTDSAAFAWLQKFGKSLMLPIAALPAAALLLRFGQPDMLGADGLGWETPAAVIGAAGDALFANLPLLFAIGLAIGMARKADGSTALAAVVGYLVFKGVGDAMSPLILGAAPEGEEQELINFNVFGGIISGLVAAWPWQKYHRIKLPDYLGFFGGRRFVPIVTSLAMLVISVLMSFLYKPFDIGLTNLSQWVAANDILGGFIYGTANRLLIPFGLHHVLNSVPWFALGEFEAGGKTHTGDIARFLNGDPTAGAFMTGFFPIMMFALPAAAMAIWHEAKPENRKATGGIMISAALTSFLTGITEPLEFAFMFVAWPLYVIHAVLTGSSIALTNALGIKDGFGFSAGFIDYALNFNIATKPLWILGIGVVYAIIYYVLFRAVIRWWNLRTPGREEEGQDSMVQADTSA